MFVYFNVEINWNWNWKIEDTQEGNHRNNNHQASHKWNTWIVTSLSEPFCLELRIKICLSKSNFISIAGFYSVTTISYVSLHLQHDLGIVLSRISLGEMKDKRLPWTNVYLSYHVVQLVNCWLQSSNFCSKYLTGWSTKL